MYRTAVAFLGLMAVGLLAAYGLGVFSGGGASQADSALDTSGQTSPEEQAAERATADRAGQDVPSGEADHAADTAVSPVGKPEFFPPALAVLQQPSTSMASLGEQMDAVRDVKLDDEGETLRALRWLLWQKKRELVLRNEVANRLDRANPDWLAGDYLGMSGDPEQPEQWRGYCVQHLKSVVAHHGGEPGVKALQAAARGGDPAVRHQAVYSLAELAQEKQWLTRNPTAYAQTVEAIESAFDSGEAGLTESGLRASMLLELIELAGKAEALAADTKEPARVRVAAVQALGVIGRAESVAVLEKCRGASEHRYVNLFAGKSLEKLKRRFPE